MLARDDGHEEGRTRRMRFVMIGDVGGADTYHVGDEAMLAANLVEFGRRRPDADFTIVSADPAASSARYGVKAVARFGFAPDGESGARERDRLLADIVAQAEKVARGEDRPQAGAVEAVRLADFVVVSGGGNLNSTWPELLYERVALLRLARCFGRRALVLGQTIGPELGASERDVLGSALRHVDLVGVRETYSLRCAEILRVPKASLSLQLDDAFFLPPASAGPAVSAEAAPRVVVTLTRGVEPVAAVAGQLAQLVRETGARLTFVPHAAAPDHDDDVGRQLAARLAPEIELEVLPVEDARMARSRVDGAAMVISSRYHPLVFALAAGVPCLGLYVDEYTRIKISGALRHGGLEDWTLPWPLARDGALLESARELWERREAVRRQIDGHRARWRAMHRDHWRRIDNVLGGGAAGAAAESPPVDHARDPDAAPAGSWGNLAGTLRTQSERAARERLALIEERDEAVRYALSLRATLAARDEENAALRRALGSPSNG